MTTLCPATNRKLKIHLEELRDASNCHLTREVADIILERSESEFVTFFQDLADHGCVCGMVGPLVYYADTRAFYDRNYAEIEDLREEYEQEIGEPLQINGDLKNFLAWFAFETIAYRIASEHDIY